MDDQTQLEVKIDDAGLTAWLIVPENFDRAQITLELVQPIIMCSDIENACATDELITTFIADAKASAGDFLGEIAKGTPPIHGTDGYIEWTVDEGQEQQQATGSASAAPTAPGRDAADQGEGEETSFYDRSVFTMLKAGDVLGRVHNPKPGTDGRGVTGKTIAAREGKPPVFNHDESILVDKNNQILAQTDGVMDRGATIICIRSTIALDHNVDFNTGNIQFDGDVLIGNDVCDCFRVEASGDIEVRGLIQAATIVTGKDLRALGGFAGREQGVAEIQGDLYAKYLDAVKIKVRGKLIVNREIINCNTYALGEIECPTGAIIGGETWCAQRIVVGEFGAEGLPLTKLVLDPAPHLIQSVKQLKAIHEEMVVQRQRLLNEEKKLKFETDPYKAKSNKQRLNELVYEIAELQGQIDRAEPTLKTLKKKTDPPCEIDLRVMGVIFPNTQITHHGMSYRIKNEIKGPLRIYQDTRGHLKFQRDGESAVMLAKQSDLNQAA